MISRKYLVASIIVIAPAVLAMSAILFAQQDKAKLKIGVLLPLKGSLASYGLELKQGMELAMSMLKDSDPDLSARMDLVIKDYESSGEKAARLAKDLLDTRQADILIGPMTGTTTITVFRSIESTQRPLISLTATQSEITKLSENVFRTSLADNYQGKILASFAATELKKTRAAIFIDPDSHYAKAIAKSFEEDFKASGGQIVAREEYKLSSDEYKKALLKIRSKNPQVILVPGIYSDVAKILEQSKALGIRSIFLGGDGWDSPKLFEMTSKEAVKGHYYLTPFNSDDNDPVVKDFVSKYQEQYKYRPTTMAALGYDGIMLIADAFKRAKTSLPQSLTRALASAQNVTSVMGPISIGPDHDALKSVAIVSTTPNGAKFKMRLGLASGPKNDQTKAQ